MNIITIRGAVTADSNTKIGILEATKEMLAGIIEANNIKQEDIIQIQFSATRDLDAVYPAVAARDMGITSASLMCAQEMYVKGSLPLCIRTSFLIRSELTQNAVKHVYLKGAKVLRPDLAE